MCVGVCVCVCKRVCVCVCVCVWLCVCVFVPVHVVSFALCSFAVFHFFATQCWADRAKGRGHTSKEARWVSTDL